MGNYQRLGYSNKLFFYTLTKRNTFNIQVSFDFKEAIVFENMRDAIEKAIKKYPELSISVAYTDGRFVSEVNDRPVPVFTDKKGEVVLGSSQTNGYLFYFLCEGNTLFLSYYHGLTDVKGMLSFVHTAFIHYASLIGLPLQEDELADCRGGVRLDDYDALITKENEMERLDPYGLFANESVEPTWSYTNHGAAVFGGVQFPESSREIHRYEIEFSLSDLLKKTKELKVSVSAFLISVCSTAAYQTENVDPQKPIIAALPVDIRKYLGIDPVVNCSDRILMPLHPEEQTLSLEAKSHILMDFMKKQICKEFFIKTITDKVNRVKAFEGAEEDIQSIVEKNIRLDISDGFHPFTYAFTYPGSLNAAGGIERLLKNSDISAYARAYSVVAYCYNDRFRLYVDSRNDDASWAKHICQNLLESGIEADIKDGERQCGDYFSLSL